MNVFNLFRRRCPACNHKGLKGHMARSVAEGMKKGLRVNPAWAWSECVRCGARFKEEHSGDGTLHPVAEKEWQEAVASTFR